MLYAFLRQPPEAGVVQIGLKLQTANVGPSKGIVKQ